MDLQARRSALTAQAQQVQAAIEQAVAQLRRMEGAIAILNEQIAEQATEEAKSGNSDISVGPDKS